MSEQSLIDYIETITIHKVRCEICRKEDQILVHQGDGEDDTPEGFAQDLMNKGWREIDSEEYGMICICCPDCVEEQTQVKGKLTKS